MLVSKEAPKAIEVVKPSPWLPKLDSAKFHKLDIVDNKVVRTPVKKLDNKLVHTPVKKVTSIKKVHTPDKFTKVESKTRVQLILKNKDKQFFEKKFEKASEGERDFSAFPDLDWAGFPSQ